MAVAPVVQPVVAQAANLPVPQPGLLNERDVVDLQRACARKHSESGRVIDTLLSIATLVAAIWAGITVGGAAGFFLACAVVIFGGNAVNTIYTSIRNRSYLDASAALDKRSFQQFILDRNLDLSIDSIVAVHNEYKKHVANQVNALRQA
jgi:hypothetical protein